MTKPLISDVTDTALWVATYRAIESKKQDALFHDPFVELLIDNSATNIALSTQGSRYTSWQVVIRTYIIDKFILKLISNDIDTVLNLGAGLDTRPYRLELPETLRWIEVDFPNIINLKNEKLNKSIPKCQLERVNLNLSNSSERDDFLKKVSSESKNVLILTEGVVPYLSNADVESLALSLFKNENFKYWITEYFSPEILAFLTTPKRMNQMVNAPFLFRPENWFNFFKNKGWTELETQYLGVESIKLGRTPPSAGWLRINESLKSENNIDSVKNFLGFTIYERVKK